MSTPKCGCSQAPFSMHVGGNDVQKAFEKVTELPKKRVGISSEEALKSVLHTETFSLFCQACPIHFWVRESGNGRWQSIWLFDPAEWWRGRWDAGAFPALHLGAGWFMVPCQNRAVYKLQQARIDPSSFLCLIFVFLNMQKTAPNYPKLASVLTCCLTPLWCQILF